MYLIWLSARLVQVAPRFVERPAAQTISEGASFTLVAEATGMPLPSFTWTRDGIVLSPGDSKKNHNIENEGGRSVLRIDRSTAENAGWYQCTAVSTAGSATSRTKVTVQGLFMYYASFLDLQTKYCIFEPYIASHFLNNFMQNTECR